MSESAEMMYVGLILVCLILGQVGDGGKCHHLHFDETMEILIGYAVLQIGSIVTCMQQH